MTLELQATPEEVMRAVENLQEFGRQRGVNERDLFALALALEESASNIVNHALRRDPRQQFRVAFDHASDTFVIELRDRGPEFDPTPAMNHPPQAGDDPAGGWGLQLVRGFMDEIRYRREAGENRLCLTKRLGRASGPQPFRDGDGNRTG